MPRIFTDNEITALLTEHKVLPGRWASRLQPKPKSAMQFDQRDCEVRGQQNHVFRIIIRQNKINPLDFSVILMFQDADGTEYRLCRYNGKHPSRHTNRLEKTKGESGSSFQTQFHVHVATQRYQEAGYDITGYAEVTTEYASLEGALRLFLDRNGFVSDEGPTLFEMQGDQK